MSLIKKSKTYKDSDGFVHNYAKKSDEDKVFPEIKPKPKKASEGYVKAKRLAEKLKTADNLYLANKQQLDTIESRLKDLTERIDVLIESDKAVHDKINPETAPEEKHDAKADLETKIEEQ